MKLYLDEDNREPNEFRDMCRSLHEAGIQCLNEIIAMDKSSKDELCKVYESTGIYECEKIS